MYAFIYNESNSDGMALVYEAIENGTVETRLGTKRNFKKGAFITEVMVNVPMSEIDVKEEVVDGLFALIVNEQGFQVWKQAASEYINMLADKKQKEDAEKQVRVDNVNKHFKSNFTINDDIRSLEIGMKNYNDGLEKAINTGEDVSFEREFYNNYSMIKDWFVKPDGSTYFTTYEA